MLENRPSILGSCEDIFSFATLHPGSAVVSETGRKWRRSQSGVEWKDRAGVQASKPPAGPLWVPSGDRMSFTAWEEQQGYLQSPPTPDMSHTDPLGVQALTVERGGGPISIVSSKKTTHLPPALQILYNGMEAGHKCGAGPWWNTQTLSLQPHLVLQP